MCRMYSSVVNFNASLNTQFVRLITFYLCLPTVGPYWLSFGAQTSQSALGKKKIGNCPMETIILVRGGFRFQMRIGCTTFHLGIVLAPAHFQRHMASLDILGYWILATWLRDGRSEVLLHKMCEKLRRFVTESVGVPPGDIFSKTEEGILQK